MKKNATQVPGYQASTYSQNDAGKLKTSTTGYTDIINLNLTTVTLCILGTCSYVAKFVMVTKEESKYLMPVMLEVLYQISHFI